MFAHIRFGFSKSVFLRGLENNLAYSSNLVGAWRLSIYLYICSLVRGEREPKSVSRNRVVREKVEFGRRAWAKEPLIALRGLTSVVIVFAPVFGNWFYGGRIICIGRNKL